MEFGNTYAVKAQRREAADGLDDFPTPPWAARAFFEYVYPRMFGASPELLLGWEPAANRGQMASVMREYLGAVMASDVQDYGVGYPVHDFLSASPTPFDARPSIVVTNPPFRLAAAFVRRAMDVAKLGCAVLVRTAWTESHDRYALFRDHPPSMIAQFVERVPMVKGRLDRKASTATAYCWIVFRRGTQPDTTRWMHIPPCRKALERETDYADNPA